MHIPTLAAFCALQALIDVLTSVRPTQDLQPVVTQHGPGTSDHCSAITLSAWGATAQHTECSTLRHHGVSHNAGAADAEAVDAHALVLFMFAQVYVRRHNAATQQPALDVWPQQSAPAEAAPAEPGSPKARTNHTGQQGLSIVLDHCSFVDCVCMASGAHSCWQWTDLQSYVYAQRTFCSSAAMQLSGRSWRRTWGSSRPCWRGTWSFCSAPHHSCWRCASRSRRARRHWRG